MSDSDNEDQEQSGYFSISGAWHEVSNSYGAAEKTTASLKLLGKGLFNTGKFLVAEALPNMIVHNSNIQLKRDDLTDEQRTKLEGARENAQKLKQRFSKK